MRGFFEALQTYSLLALGLTLMAVVITVVSGGALMHVDPLRLALILSAVGILFVVGWLGERNIKWEG